MIEVVIKRDGSKEAFNAGKLNKWAEWASSNLGDFVDWPSVAMQAVSTLGKECTSKQLQERLIRVCLDNDSWSYYKMAGRLLAAILNKEIFPEGKPTVQGLHKSLVKRGLMVDLGYTDSEYAAIEDIIDHDLDFNCVYFGLDFINGKYANKDRTKNEVYETTQFVYMRMAMALSRDEVDKVKEVSEWYKLFSENVINAPTPNYVNLGTKLNGLSSCCVYTTNDTWPSLAAGNHIDYVMTCMSSGIGSHIKTRSVGDGVRSGAIKHMGKLPYYRAIQGAVQANMQAGRGGAATVYYTCYDPEVLDLLQLRNPRQTEDKRIRGLHYNMGSNKTFARAVAKNEDVFGFSYKDNPELYEAQYEGDQTNFEQLYDKYSKTRKAAKYKINAREVLVTSLTEAFETGTAYLHFTDEMNRHTPFKDKIYSSNLCVETAFPTKGYSGVEELYSPVFLHSEDGLGKQEPEIGLCSLAAINVANIKNDAHYAKAAYYALKMIDKCIHMSDFAFPHLELTAKARMNAGVGIVGLAHYMAKNKKFYSSQEGKDKIHELAETHSWHVINASLRLGKELGNATWMGRTKWPDGWLPIDTYNKSVDEVVTVGLQRDWEGLRKAIVDNGGIRNSCLVNHMPSESSSKASQTTNSVYPVRDLTLIKTDASVNTLWAAPDGDKLKKWYEFAWDIETKDMIDVYAIIQKFTDQSISADLYRKLIGDETVTTQEMIRDYLRMVKMGMKTRYYQNTKTSNGTELDVGDTGCAGGVCTL